MANIREYDEFIKTAHELVEEREELRKAKNNMLGKSDDEIGTLYFIDIDSHNKESEEELNERILLFNKKWDEYVEECFKQSPFLYRLKYVIGINNLQEDERQKVEGFENKIKYYTEEAAASYQKLNNQKTKILSR